MDYVMAKVEQNSGRESQTPNAPLVWLDLMKAIALFWIFLNHSVEQLFGYPYIANPTADWPSFADRLAQLRPVDGYGIWTVPVNLLRYVGWTGDQGVQLFLIVSGFGLTWGLLSRNSGGSLPLARFYRRRAGRVYPVWWGAHLLFMVAWLVLGRGLSAFDPNTYLSLVGIRFTPGTIYYFAPAWWYIGLLLQLYLVFPLLWASLRRIGPLWLLFIGSAIAFVARGLGMAVFEGYLDPWLRGAIFITRLPEFLFGITLAAWLFANPERIHSQLASIRTILLALVCYVVGIVLALTWAGMIIAPFLLGTAAFVILYAILARIQRPANLGARSGTWVGRHSYSLYLLHHPFILLLVPAGLALTSRREILGIVATALLTFVVAIVLERVVDASTALLSRWWSDVGVVRAALRVVVILGAVGVLLLGAELFVRWAAPQEVPEFGWGERKALEPHPIFGWRLKPSQETRLRWESYDYTVTANALGFPGPEYAQEEPPGTLRIMTVGDAFTSAEGVDTAQAWPRLLEDELTARLSGEDVEVLNFGITGYGPNQYAAVVEEFAPIYEPDIVLIGFFVNEFHDVLESNEGFQRSIGFSLLNPDGVRSIIRLAQLRHWIGVWVAEPLEEMLRNQPRPYGYFLGQFAALELGSPELELGQPLVVDQMRKITQISESVDAQVVLAMIPAPVQVCGPLDLTYYPRHVDLTDQQKYDPGLPQRLVRTMAADLGFQYYDLRAILRSNPTGCPYQPRNMHWTVDGHRIVASYLAEELLADGYVRR